MTETNDSNERETSGSLWIDPTLYTSRPADESARPEAERRTYDLLDALGIRYVRLDHGETPSIEACEEVERLLGIEIVKNLFLCNRQMTSFYLLMMPGRKEFRTKDLSKQIDSSRLSFASAESMKELLGTLPGSASVLGLMNDREHRIKLLIDKDILKNEYFGCHPCVNTSSLKVRMADILEKFLPYTGHEPAFVEL
jgi:Ala-tRNA(Pro) deacylase